jgi:hypothetical protein
MNNILHFASVVPVRRRAPGAAILRALPFVLCTGAGAGRRDEIFFLTKLRSARPLHHHTVS